jgi:hypothetical protein
MIINSCLVASSNWHPIQVSQLDTSHRVIRKRVKLSLVFDYLSLTKADGAQKSSVSDSYELNPDPDLGLFFIIKM